MLSHHGTARAPNSWRCQSAECSYTMAPQGHRIHGTARAPNALAPWRCKGAEFMALLEHRISLHTCVSCNTVICYDIHVYIYMSWHCQSAEIFSIMAPRGHRMQNTGKTPDMICSNTLYLVLSTAELSKRSFHRQQHACAFRMIQ